jgi:hypothetical protein
MDWAGFPKTSSSGNNTGDAMTISEMNPSYAVQIVRQVNYGPLESKRYFIAVREKADEPFLEVTERDLIEANYEKLNSFVFSLARSSEAFFFREANHIEIEFGLYVTDIKDQVQELQVRRS